MKGLAKTSFINLEEIPPNRETKSIIIVPYRNDPFNQRKEQLDKFVEHYHNYLPNITILIVEQSQDNRKFNRGAVLNIGVKIAQEYNFDRYIVHDVDLLSPDSISPTYTYNPDNPVHIANLWKEKYKHERFFGGIVSFNLSNYYKINGFPNTFWGWGGEDDAMYRRIKINDLEIIKIVSDNPENKIQEMKHKNLTDDPKFKNTQKEKNVRMDIKNWKRNGINTVKFEILNCKNLKFKNVIFATVKILN